MKSLLLVWLIANTLLLFVCLVGVFVLLRDRKQLRRKQQKLEQIIAELSSKQEQTKKFLDNWLTMLENVEKGAVNASEFARGLAKVVHRFSGIEIVSPEALNSNQRSPRQR